MHRRVRRKDVIAPPDSSKANANEVKKIDDNNRGWTGYMFNFSSAKAALRYELHCEQFAHVTVNYCTDFTGL